MDLSFLKRNDYHRLFLPFVPMNYDYRATQCEFYYNVKQWCLRDTSRA